jgi:isocitrate/isopropylmalate dehydrogenase
VGDKHGFFQSIHGSAPDIAGKGIVNPIAAILHGVFRATFLGGQWKNERKTFRAVGDEI